jgi:hypothetical protein
LVVVLGVASYGASYRHVDFSAPLDGIESSRYADMFDYIVNHTPADSTFIFDKPRTLALYTNRRAAAIYGTRKGDELISYMRKIGGRYILFYDPWEGGQPRAEYVRDYLRDHVGDFEPVHESGPYALYEIKPGIR